MSPLCAQSAAYPHGPLGGLGAVQEKATLPETHFTLLPQGPNDTGTAHRAPGAQGLVLTALCAFTPGSYEAHTTSAPKQVLDSCLYGLCPLQPGSAGGRGRSPKITGLACCLQRGASCRQPPGQARPSVHPTSCHHHFFLKLWSQTHNMKMVIVTIFTRVVQGSTFTLLCHYHCHLSPELSSLQN